MFQNIVDEMHEDEEIRQKRYIKANKIFKELFNFRNLFIYVITFFMSTLAIKQDIIPFGLAIVAACISSYIPILGVYSAALIGTFVGNGISALSNFIAISIMYLILVLVFKSKVAVEERNENLKTGGKLFLANFSIEQVKNFDGIFLIYDLLLGIISSALVYVFYKIFVNGIIVFKEFKIKKAFTVEELIASSIMLAIASLAFCEVSIFSVNISNIICVLMIMIIGWKSGMLLGATCGISIGIAVGLSTETSFIQILMFAFSGIFSGLLNRFGKIGVIIGFILGNVALTYATNGNSLVLNYFREIFIASVGLLFIPNIKLNIKDILGDKVLLSDIGENRLNEGEKEVSNKLKTVTNMFYEMMNSKTESVENLKEEFVEEFLNNLEEKNANVFYEEIINEQNGIATDIYDCIEKNELILDKDLINILTEHNNYIFMQDLSIKNDLQEIIKIANRSYKIVQINLAKKQERNKNIKAITSNLKQATKIIDNCADKIKDKEECIFQKKEKEIELLLKSKKIEINRCIVKKLKNQKYIVFLEILNEKYTFKEKEILLSIENIISKSLNCKVIFQREKSIDEKKICLIYASEDKYLLQVGSAKLAKENNNVSGDCNLQMKLEDGKYLLSIADGMGSGRKARESSKFTIKMIKELISTGFEKEESIEIINSSLELNAESETYSSLDISIFDLYTGEAEIIKNGACSTYIKNNKKVRKITLNSLPLGIMDKVELKTENVLVEEGDIFVMCSDGIYESKEELNKDWIEEFLKNVTTNNAQKIADLLLAEAVDNNYGIAKDDMTVIVSKIVKKK